MKSLLIDVDTQEDFMYESGTLYVPGAESIIPNIQRTMLCAVKTGTPIISTMDWHDEDDAEFKVYPSHCVAESGGAEKIIESIAYGPKFIWEPSWEVPMDQCMQFLIKKKTYNVWDKTLGDPGAIGAMLCTEPANIFLMGVATEICVLAAARGLVNHIHNFTQGWIPKLYLIEDAIKGLKPEAEQAAIAEMVNLGFRVIKSTDLQGVM